MSEEANVDSWSCTNYESFTVSRKWTLLGLKRFCQDGQVTKLEDTPFTGGLAEWHLELNPNYYNPNNKIRYLYLTTFLDKTAENHSVLVEMRISLTVRYYHTQKYTVSSSSVLNPPEAVSQDHRVEVAKEIKYVSTYGPYRVTAPWNKSTSLIDTPQLLKACEFFVDDEVTILCELKIAHLSARKTIGSVVSSHDPPNSLVSDLQALLQNGELSDVVLVAEGKELPAHQFVLSARSPAFKAMLHHDMREKTEQRIKIEDLSVDTVKGMLKWMYTDQLPSTELESKSLLRAADKYNLDPLKKACERSLCRVLTVSNATELFELADLHHADSLKKECVQFIAANSSEVKATVGWKQLKRDVLAELAILLLDL